MWILVWGSLGHLVSTEATNKDTGVAWSTLLGHTLLPVHHQRGNLLFRLCAVRSAKRKSLI